MTGVQTCALPISVTALKAGAYDYLVKDVGHKYIQFLPSIIEKAIKQKQSEEQLHKLYHAVEQSPGGIVITDATGRIEYVNPQFAKITGYGADEIVGTNVVDINEHTTRELQQIGRSIEAGEEWLGEFQEKKKDGNLYWVSVHISPMRDSDHAISNFVIAYNDITERKLIENQIKETNERMTKELEAAAEVQKSLLPKDLPEVPGVNFAWLFKACDELAGDILNVFWLDDTNIGLYVLDVSGHGVAAALTSVSLSRILSPSNGSSSILIEERRADSSAHPLVSPKKVASILNSQYSIDLESEQYFTILYGILNLARMEFRFVSAGHPKPILVASDGPRKLAGSAGLPIGFDAEEDYKEEVVQLNPGDRLFFYSDGIPEALEPSGQEQFGYDRLLDLLNHHYATPLKRSLTSVVQGVDEWADHKIADDISILAVELTQSPT